MKCIASPLAYTAALCVVCLTHYHQFNGLTPSYTKSQNMAQQTTSPFMRVRSVAQILYQYRIGNAKHHFQTARNETNGIESLYKYSSCHCHTEQYQKHYFVCLHPTPPIARPPQTVQLRSLYSKSYTIPQTSNGGTKHLHRRLTIFLNIKTPNKPCLVIFISRLI